ncbi:MAG: ankyrin repeat domain-containing protein [Parvularculales bacterium]
MRTKTSIFFGCLLLLAVSHSPLQAQDNVLLDLSFWQTATVADVESALGRGADVNGSNKRGLTPLHGAVAASRTPAVVELLLDRGADTEARDKVNGLTPLHAAGRFSKTPAVVEVLLKHGADINARAKGDITPLHVAALSSETPAVVELLLDYGADGAAEDKKGRTPFEFSQANEALKNTEAFRRLKAAQ